MILIYRIVLLGNILLTWATLQQPYMSKTLSAPHHKTRMTGYTQLFLNLNQKYY